MRRDFSALISILVLSALAAGCGTNDEEQPNGIGDNRVEITFWHTQADRNQQILLDIIRQFNETHDTIRVKPVYVAGYSQIFRKLKSAVIAQKLPDLAIAYESMVAEYTKSGVVVPLDQYLNDPDVGLSRESIGDIYPVFIETNRFPQFDNQLLSFPFTKSLLMMYSNADMLKEAGFDSPPKTWKEFVEQCSAVKRLGKSGYALSVDPSTVHAMIMSLGGEIVNPKTLKTGYDEPAGLAAFKLIDRMVEEELAYQIKFDSYDDRADLAGERCAFMIRSSTSRPYLHEMIKDKFDWTISIPPHGKGQPPVTVLFGANICMFKSTPERQRAAWEFIRYFCSTEVTALWATKTGYMPVRRSATSTDMMKAFFAECPQNSSTIAVLPYAQPEPNLNGMQHIRDLVDNAQTRVISGIDTPEKATRELAKEAERVLKEAL